jgi:hypothetical protein
MAVGMPTQILVIRVRPSSLLLLYQTAVRRPLLAQSGQPSTLNSCPLLGLKRTLLLASDITGL